MKTTSPGICWLAGAGPGDPGLLTLRAKECLEAADVVVYDYLVNPAILAHARPEAELIYAGKKARAHTLPQEEINALIVRLALEGKKILRLKGGDPVLFGRGAEEAAELREAGIPFEFIPGVTSALAAPIYAGIPVTHREHSSQLTIFTGHEDPAKTESSLDYDNLVAAPGTKLMLMGIERLRPITGEFLSRGTDPSTPVALIRWGTTTRQEVLTGTLGTIADLVEAAAFKAPAIVVIGAVAALREELRWFDNRPLFGKRIVVTRTRQQASELSRQLRDLGADAFELPTIRIEEPRNPMLFGELVQDAHTYDWLIFTSPNGAESFFKMFYKLYSDARSIGGVRIAAIGPGTAQKIKEYHLAVDLMPSKFIAESLVEALKELDVANQTMLWVKADETRELLGKELLKLGAIVDEAIAYRTVMETKDITGGQARLRDEGADVITFTSASTVDCFMALKLPLPEGVKLASIGPVTSDAIRKHGLKVDIEAMESTIAGLVQAISDHFGQAA